MSGTMTITLNVWRQSDSNAAGRFVTYTLPGVSPDMSFLEMLDLLNLDLIRKGHEAIAFDHDCREG
ncbi:MAG TPA: succinate dehydrogenase/fumarate reductase iron-sulfur subunit, partial [Bacteroidota bacterium]|nr:succinate dehydrogenase/fumarate reductase iron-sulfur subunit [Bacteroidota bacterium]